MRRHIKGYNNNGNKPMIAIISGGVLVIGVATYIIVNVLRANTPAPMSLEGRTATTSNTAKRTDGQRSAEEEAAINEFREKAYAMVHNTGKTYELSTDETSETTEDGVRLSKDGVYMKDTTYDGNTSLPLNVFTTPFQKDVLYISNKEFMDRLKDGAADTIMDYAVSSVNDIWGKGASYIRENRDEYVNTVTNYLIDQMYQGQGGFDDELYTNKEVAENLADWFVNNNVEADVTFTTDKSLIYADSYIFIRGVLDIKPINCDTDEMANFIPGGMDYKNGGKYVCEVIVGYYADIYKELGIKEYQVLGYQIIEEIK